jgi:hypothetical protein
VANALTNLAWAALHGSDHERALTLFEEALEYSRELGDNKMLAESLEGIAGGPRPEGTPSARRSSGGRPRPCAKR